ncbi:hypothetical protein GGF32_005532, partial [Allomyces javanicus]
DGVRLTTKCIHSALNRYALNDEEYACLRANALADSKSQAFRKVCFEVHRLISMTMDGSLPSVVRFAHVKEDMARVKVQSEQRCAQLRQALQALAAKRAAPEVGAQTRMKRQRVEGGS